MYILRRLHRLHKPDKEGSYVHPAVILQDAMKSSQWYTCGPGVAREMIFLHRTTNRRRIFSLAVPHPGIRTVNAQARAQIYSDAIDNRLSPTELREIRVNDIHAALPVGGAHLPSPHAQRSNISYTSISISEPVFPSLPSSSLHILRTE